MSFELTMGGLTTSPEKALKMFEITVPDIIPEEAKTEEFCEQYEAALNRVRRCLRNDVARRPKFFKAMKRMYNHYVCPQCGKTINREMNKVCHGCGQMIDWSFWPNDNELELA